MRLDRQNKTRIKGLGGILMSLFLLLCVGLGADSLIAGFSSEQVAHITENAQENNAYINSLQDEEHNSGLQGESLNLSKILGKTSTSKYRFGKNKAQNELHFPAFSQRPKYYAYLNSIKYRTVLRGISASRTASRDYYVYALRCIIR